MLWLSSCSAADVADPASVDTGDESPVLGDLGDADSITDEQLVLSIEAFWTEEFAAAGPTEFEPVDPKRVIGLSAGRRSQVTCDGVKVRFADVADNALATDCAEGPLVAWDAGELTPELREQYGVGGPGLLLAHEYGHVVQYQRHNGDLSSIVAEQQADCYAGAWLAFAIDEVPAFAGDDVLDAVVGTALDNADGPGDLADDPDAHGSGFDRLRAMQDGLNGGAAYCDTYPEALPALVLPSGSTAAVSAPAATELAAADDAVAVLRLVRGSLNDYAVALSRGFRPITSVEDLGEASGRCDGVKASRLRSDVVVCRRRGTLMFHRDALADAFATRGAAGVAARVALAWADAIRVDAGERLASGSARAARERVCLVGGWFRTLLANGGIGALRDSDAAARPAPATGLAASADDLDAAIATVVDVVDTAAADAAGAGFGRISVFDAAEALRDGVLDGPTACGLRH